MRKTFVKDRLFALIREIMPDLFENQAHQVSQLQLSLQYQQAKYMNFPLPRFQDTGFGVYSQNDEDGLLLYLFSMIGMTNKVCVDIAFGLPYGANTTNLICNWGWNGLLFEGDNKKSERSKLFFKSQRYSRQYPPRIINTWVNAENINSLLKENNLIGEIDLFSLDVDGIDYWLWKSLDVIEPRVVVAEYRNVLGPEKSLTVEYKKDFNQADYPAGYHGASLPAFVKLAKEKGYRLVGCNRYGFNAFFVRHGIGEDVFPEISASQCFEHLCAKNAMDKRMSKTLKLNWMSV